MCIYSAYYVYVGFTIQGVSCEANVNSLQFVCLNNWGKIGKYNESYQTKPKRAEKQQNSTFSGKKNTAKSEISASPNDTFQQQQRLSTLTFFNLFNIKAPIDQFLFFTKRL